MNNALEIVEVNPTKPAQRSVIWLHGLGADGHDFEPIVAEMQLPAELAIRFVFPHAPVRTITINNLLPMRAWYDIVSLSLHAVEDEIGIKESQQLVEALIQQEVSRGIKPENIILAGFSQGGAMALYTGLRYRERLAGLIGLSCYMPLHQSFIQEASRANKQQIIFMAHGLHDQIVPISLGELSRMLLESQQHQVEWHSYPMEHSVCTEEIKAVSTWLQARFT